MISTRATAFTTARSRAPSPTPLSSSGAVPVQTCASSSRASSPLPGQVPVAAEARLFRTLSSSGRAASPPQAYCSPKLKRDADESEPDFTLPESSFRDPLLATAPPDSDVMIEDLRRGRTSSSSCPPFAVPAPPPLTAADRILAALEFRPLEPIDIEDMQDLHVECFPIKYELEFYKNSCHGRKILSIAAVLPPGVSLPPGTELAWSARGSGDGKHDDRSSRGRLVGVITASIIKENDCEDARWLLPFSFTERRVAYILTLGVRQPFRRHGIARVLLERLCRHVSTIPTCKALYLHTASDNESAARFYESNSFTAARMIQGFYLIDGARCDSVVYVHYINNGDVAFWPTECLEICTDLARAVGRALRSVQYSTVHLWRNLTGSSAATCAQKECRSSVFHFIALFGEFLASKLRTSLRSYRHIGHLNSPGYNLLNV